MRIFSVFSRFLARKICQWRNVSRNNATSIPPDLSSTPIWPGATSPPRAISSYPPSVGSMCANGPTSRRGPTGGRRAIVISLCVTALLISAVFLAAQSQQLFSTLVGNGLERILPAFPFERLIYRTRNDSVNYCAQYSSLQDCVNSLPPSGGVAELPAGAIHFSFPLVIVGDAVRLVGRGRDESGNGSHLVFDAPSSYPAWAAKTAYAKGAMLLDSNGDAEIAMQAGLSGSSTPAWSTTLGATSTDSGVVWLDGGPPAAIYFVNAYGSAASNFSLSQGNNNGSVNGLVAIGVHESDFENFYVGSQTGADFNFSNVSLLLADSAVASSIYNTFRNFSVTGGAVACKLAQNNAGKVVNANLFERGLCGESGTHSIYLAGNASENSFVNVDVTGDAHIQVQLGDVSTGQCRDNNFREQTQENESNPVGQIGFDNYCLATVIDTEGALTGSSPTMIVDETGASHWLIHSSGSAGGTYSESTIPPLEWSAAHSSVGIGVAAPSGPGLAISYGPFSGLPACSAGLGMLAMVSDSTTSTVGAAITGSGANKVLAFCDGTSWKVASN